MEKHITLKPKFCFWLIFIRAFILLFIFLGTFIRLWLGFRVEGTYAMLIAFVVCLLTAKLIAYLYKLLYAQTVYTIKDNHVEISSSFMGVRQQTARFSSIEEVHLKCGFLQKHAGVGTVVLLTRATPSTPNSSNAGLHLSDIENAREIANLLQGRIG